MKPEILKALQGLAVGAACAACAIVLHRTGWFETLELKTLDLRFRQVPRHMAAAPDEVVIVAIDQDSIEHVHQRIRQRWPWPREFYGMMVDFLADAGARAVVFDVFFTEPDINRLDISSTESDAALAEATAAHGHVYHAAILKADGLPPPADEWQALVTNLAVFAATCRDLPPLPVFDSVALPAANLSAASRLVGFANINPVRDNIFRRIPLLAARAGVVLPSLSMGVAWDLKGRPPVGGADGALALAHERIPVNRAAEMYLWWYKPPVPPEDAAAPPCAFRYIPAAAVLTAQVRAQSGEPPGLDPALFTDKIVFLGSTAPGLFDVRATPLAHITPGVEIQATALLNLLHGHGVRRCRPSFTLLLIVAASLLVGSCCHGLRHAMLGASAILVTLAILAGGGAWALSRRHVFLEIVPPMTAALGTFLIATFTNYLAERRHSRLVRGIFEHYLDRSVVRTLIRNPDQVRLGGEKRHCTVLFSDVANFTSTSEQMQPEEVVQFMNEYLDAMTTIIMEEGGFLDKFVGDEIVAVFGAPQQLPDHALRACRAVLRMQARVQELQPRFRELGCPTEIFARTGISTGYIIVGNMGSQRRMNYTAMGDVMNLGARLEGTNKVYGTRAVVSADTVEGAAAMIRFRELDCIRVKGKTEGVRVFELVGDAQQVDPDTGKRLDHFAAGLAHYRDRRWKEAADAFAAAAAMGDAPAQVFAERCQHYRADPPPPDWDGTYVMQTK